MTKNLLLIGAHSTAAAELLTAAAELDVAVHVATHWNVFAEYDDELKSGIAGTVFPNFLAPQAALDELVAFCRAHDIAGVVAGWEFLSPIATKVAARLGLPGNDERLADACRNKALMARAFEAAGVPAPRSRLASSYESAVATLSEMESPYPIVVKPVENAASIGVSVVDSLGELKDAFHNAQRWMNELPHGIPLDVSVLLQDYVDGKEFSVESVVHRGVFHHLAITEKITTTGAVREEAGHAIPAILPDEDRRLVLRTAEQAMAVLGLRNGVAHTELKIRPDGTVSVIEVGARPPGDHIMRVLRHARGISQARAYLQVALGEAPDVTESATGAAAVRFLTTLDTGTLREVRGLPESPRVVESCLYLHPGDVVGNYYEKHTRIGHVILREESHEAVSDLAAEVVRGIEIDVDGAHER